MKRIVVFCLLLFSLSSNCQTKKNIDKEILIPEFNKILSRWKVKGAILIYSYTDKTYYSNDFSWAKKGKLPASTFKIPNSIIALETGVIKQESTIFKWNGEKRGNKNWEKDLTFQEAFRVSCVPCYQEVARKIGLKRMKSYLQKFQYDNMIFDRTNLDTFWLEGKSKISPMAQIEFLKKFYFSELPISNRTTTIVKTIMKREQTTDYVWSGKTGLSSHNGQYNGWFVGFLEADKKVYFFATNMEPSSKVFVKEEFYDSRILATKDAFKSCIFKQ